MMDEEVDIVSSLVTGLVSQVSNSVEKQEQEVVQNNWREISLCPQGLNLNILKPKGEGLLKRKTTPTNVVINANAQVEHPPPPKKKRSITFDGVTVYYFPRAQGFTCVPSQGGSTLGMSQNHSHCEQFTLAQHAEEQRRAHKQLLLRVKKQSPNPAAATKEGSTSESGSSSEENDGEQTTDSELEGELESFYFLQPVSAKQRRAMLREAGVQKIDPGEKNECKDIRASREFCGCSCKVYCDPLTCSCALNDIKCQVDRVNFPCGCTRENCGNHSGRVEFNPVRVRTHFIHTTLKLEMEKKQQALLDSHYNWDQFHNHQSTSFYPIPMPTPQPVRDGQFPTSLELSSCVTNYTNFTYHANVDLNFSSISHPPPPAENLYVGAIDSSSSYSENSDEFSGEIQQINPNGSGAFYDYQQQQRSYYDYSSSAHHYVGTEQYSGLMPLHHQVEEEQQQIAMGMVQSEDSPEVEENFGELIKKSMVESQA